MPLQWFKPFFMSWLNIFDFAIILCSWVGVMSDEMPSGVAAFRVIRAFRVLRILRFLRLFRFMVPLRVLITALFSAFWPVLHSLFLLLSVITIFSVIGTQVFAEKMPARFGDLKR